MLNINRKEVWRSAFIKPTIVLALSMSVQHSLFAQASANHFPTPTVRVPFVGCESDGQAGPLKAPTGKSRAVLISAEAANQLTYYKAENGFGVLAPHGWYCFGTYGSSGGSLFVSPQPIKTSDFFSSKEKWRGLTASGIQFSTSVGGTSGRFDVARIIARVFPAYKHFVEDVIAEDIVPKSAFPFGPYLQDKLTYKGKNIVEFETPANTDGLGTDSWLKKNATPIRGTVILMEEEPDSMPSALSLTLRLPLNLNNLTSVILQEAEREAQTQNTNEK